MFLLPDAWGQLNLYAGLVDRLETERPVLGLHLPLTDADGRHRAVPDVAADAVAQIREAQPEGAYSLIGYSFGGMVAYAAATALVAAGVALDLVGLIDVVPPAAALTGFQLRTRGWIQRVQRMRRGKRGTSVDIPPGPTRVPAPRRAFSAGHQAGGRRLPAGAVRRDGLLLPGRPTPAHRRQLAVGLAPGRAAPARDRGPGQAHGHRRQRRRRPRPPARGDARRPHLGRSARRGALGRARSGHAMEASPGRGRSVPALPFRPCENQQMSDVGVAA